MIGNSLVGATLFVGEAVTLHRITGEVYSTVTGKPTATSVDYPTKARVRGLTERDRRRLGSDLVKGARFIAVVPAAQLPAGVAPKFSDQLIGAATTWEILAVQIRRAHGIVYEYECQLGGTGVAR